jgi:hypothetical protein
LPSEDSPTRGPTPLRKASSQIGALIAFSWTRPLHLFEDRRPLLRVEFVGLQWEEFVDVGIAA